MKKSIAIWTVLLLLSSIGSTAGLPAQEPQDPNLSVASSFVLEFAVPNSPAFKLLDVDASKVLRPSTVRELTGALSSFIGDGIGVTLPKKVGVEFSPGLLVRGRTLSRAEYARNAWLYRLRLSLATSRPDSGTTATSLSFGLRTSILDDADLRGDVNFVTLAEQFQANAVAAADSLDTVFATELDAERAAVLSDEVVTAMELEEGSVAQLAAAESVIRSDTTLTLAQRETLVRLLYAMALPELDRSRLDHVKDSLQNELWNATALDFAVAGLASGADSTAASLEMRKWALWGTWAQSLGRNGQLLLGAQATTERDEEGEEGEETEDDDGWKGTASLSARVYFGANYLKAFIEGQGEARDQATPRWLLNSGGEFRPNFGGWFKFSAGLEFGESTDGPDLVTSFAFNFGLPNPF